MNQNNSGDNNKPRQNSSSGNGSKLPRRQSSASSSNVPDPIDIKENIKKYSNIQFDNRNFTPKNGFLEFEKEDEQV